MAARAEISQQGATSGRRARKKTRTRHELLTAARRLFNRKGYDGTAIEEIAEAADVSVGTVYNYFPTKMHLLVDMLEAAIGDVMAADLATVANPPRDAVAAVHGLIMSYLKVFSGFDRALLRQLTTAIFQDLRTFGTRNNTLEALMSDQLEAMLNAMLRRGSLAAGTPVKTLTRMLFNIANSEYYIWVGDDAVTLDAVSRSLKAQYAIALRGVVTQPRPFQSHG